MSHDSVLFISDLRILDRSNLCDYLDSGERWKDFAASVAKDHFGDVTELDISIIERQESSGRSASNELLNILQEKHTSLVDIYHCLQDANLLYATTFIKQYVPELDHLYGPHYPVNNCNAAEPKPPPIEMVRDEMSAADASMEVERPNVFMNVAHQPQRQQRPSEIDSPAFTSAPPVNPGLTEDDIRRGQTIITMRTFNYQHLAAATNQFSDEYLIANGRHGSVYKCKIDNTLMAIKKYDSHYEALKSDLQFTRNFNHPNIVPITGKSFESDNAIILYEYMSNGSLEVKLRERGKFAVDKRLDILMDAARGLQYLHSNNPPYIHGNIKSSNILLDDALRARLSDFGMARHANKGDDSHGLTHYSTKASTSVIITNRGYNSPEVGLGKVSKKSDTFAFGVVIFEICTGKVAYLETERPSKLYEKCDDYTGDPFELRDQSIPWNPQTYSDLFQLARHCVRSRKKDRPEMAQVYEKIEQIKADMTTHNQEVPESSEAQQHVYVNYVATKPSRLGQPSYQEPSWSSYTTAHPYPSAQGAHSFQNLPACHHQVFLPNPDSPGSPYSVSDSFSLRADRQLSSLGDLEIHSLKSESSYPDGYPAEPPPTNEDRNFIPTHPDSVPKELNENESPGRELDINGTAERGERREDDLRVHASFNEKTEVSSDCSEDEDYEAYAKKLLESMKTNSCASQPAVEDEDFMSHLNELSLNTLPSSPSHNEPTSSAAAV